MVKKYICHLLGVSLSLYKGCLIDVEKLRKKYQQNVIILTKEIKFKSEKTGH